MSARGAPPPFAVIFLAKNQATRRDRNDRIRIGYYKHSRFGCRMSFKSSVHQFTASASAVSSWLGRPQVTQWLTDPISCIEHPRTFSIKILFLVTLRIFPSPGSSEFWHETPPIFEPPATIEYVKGNRPPPVNDDIYGKVSKTPGHYWKSESKQPSPTPAALVASHSEK